ncbi:MAG: rhombosortase [Gammaproteobacteria bacterium]|nr:rhombosortase [Gammaproteobacteria bacterium]
MFTSHLGLLVPLLLISIFSLIPELSGELRYQRNEILIGEWWRIYSGQLGHMSINHLLLNLGGLVIFWLLFSRTTSSTIWLLVIALTMTTTGLGLLWLSPQLEWYLGFSGVLHALFFCALIFELKLGRRSTTIPLLMLLLAKLTWEMLIGATPGSAELIGGNVVVDAHLYGALSGIAIATLIPSRLIRSQHSHPDQNGLHPIERHFS